MRENAETEIQSVAAQAAKELRVHSSELALDLARQKIAARLTPDMQGTLVDTFVTMIRRPKGPAN
jgi:F0F1-type ATP synthase membrane subunit b/b'